MDRHVERLTEKIMLAFVSTLVRLYSIRFRPETLQAIRKVVEDALQEAAIAGKLDTLHPPVPLGPDQSMIDTKPYKARPKTAPPPLPKKKDP